MKWTIKGKYWMASNNGKFTISKSSIGNNKWRYTLWDLNTKKNHGVYRTAEEAQINAKQIVKNLPRFSPVFGDENLQGTHTVSTKYENWKKTHKNK